MDVHGEAAETIWAEMLRLALPDKRPRRTKQDLRSVIVGRYESRDSFGGRRFQ